VVGEGDDGEGVDLLKFTVVDHIVEESFFIREVEIIL
jgi:hypothetical protein